jgi:hypothetical protein
MMDSIACSGQPGGPTLNLVNALIAGASGPSLHPPSVRIAAESVSAWWIVDFTVKNTGGGASVGFGVAF